MDEIREHIRLNIFTWTGEHLSDAYINVNEAIDYIERYKENDQRILADVMKE